MAALDLGTVAGVADLAARAIALAGVVVAGVVAGTHWAVRRRKLAPFGRWSRSIRQLSDPALRPIERRLLRSGGNPQDATYWLFGIAVLFGLLLISVVRWVAGFIYGLVVLSDAGAMTWVRTVVGWAFSLVIVALFIRVIASWFGVSPYRRWMRPIILLTDWLLNPIRRFMPATGIIDLSPLIAYLILIVLRAVVTSALAG